MSMTRAGLTFAMLLVTLPACTSGGGGRSLPDAGDRGVPLDGTAETVDAGNASDDSGGDGNSLSDAGDGRAPLDGTAETLDAGDASGDMDASTVCGELEDAAVQQFDSILKQNLACSLDTDCAWSAFAQDAWCVAHCGALTNEASVASVQSTANILCQPFVAQGCEVPASSCGAGPLICAGGTCANYSFYVTPYPLAMFTHGVCTALQVNYSPSGGSPNAPHDLAVSISASNGTLYSDPACTMPIAMGSLTIGSGLSSVPFGIIATSPGDGSLDVDDVTFSFTAQ